MIQKFENLILSQLENIITNILQSTTSLPISAKSRAGAEISDWLEKEFVLTTQKHQYFFNSEAAPEGQLKIRGMLALTLKLIKYPKKFG